MIAAGSGRAESLAAPRLSITHARLDGAVLRLVLKIDLVSSWIPAGFLARLTCGQGCSAWSDRYLVVDVSDPVRAREIAAKHGALVIEVPASRLSEPLMWETSVAGTVAEPGGLDLTVWGVW